MTATPQPPRGFADGMTRRRRRLLSLAVAAVLAGLVPPAMMLALSYFNTERDARRMLDGQALVLQSRAAEILENAEATLAGMARQMDPRCTERSLEVLRKAVYNSLYFREAGLVYDDSVQCTSERVFDPPVPIEKADHRTMPVGQIHIAAPDRTLEGEVSIIILYRIADATAVNLLLNPKQLTEPLFGAIDPGQISLRVLRDDGAVLAQYGEPSERVLLQASREVPGYPVRVEAGGTRSWLLQQWRRSLPFYLGFGLLLSLPIFLLLRRYERQEKSVDVQVRDALEAGDLRVHYQPIHALDDGRVVGVEALVRWHHPERGLVLPQDFIASAEASGFIVQITHWLMRTVRDEIGALGAEHADVYVAMNLSPKHFSDPELPALIHGIFGAPFATGRLVFELTERELVDGSNDTASAIIRALRDCGARIALDDFGTGYSSLRYLSQFEFDLLKIDKAFIDAIGTGSVTAGLVDDMFAIAQRLGMKTIAEGVETEAQIAYLRRLGVECVQGWYYSKALPIEQLPAYLQRHGARSRPGATAPLSAAGAALP